MIVMVVTIIAVFVISAILLVYLSSVTFTAIRAYDYNVKFSIPTLFVIPLILIVTHINIYNTYKYSDKKKAFKLFLFIFKKYPVAIAIFLTIVASNIAEQNVKVSKGVSYRKTKSLQQKKRMKSIERVLRSNTYGEMLLGT
ncbi:hypothetical protein FNK43_01575 [Staphylococcus agnetis]|nr:hypothetical protein [Staphylococcus agnetis]NJH67435.1 hypothetical protein [Staphylococcus agnetis]NJH85811.1 hypothetical protein [Staphylococcus agnetis]NJI15344.1 hypothetical protein [Staphylococcus agnetis]PTH64493.1 hypothetical protein BU582_12175 [Staphylococcus agnetis]